MRNRKTTRRTKLGQTGIRKGSWGGSSRWLEQALGLQLATRVGKVVGGVSMRVCTLFAGFQQEALYQTGTPPGPGI
jgi:hypothetical protein